MDQKARDIRELIDTLNDYTEAYNKGLPKISDKAWDDLYFKLKKMEEETGIIYRDSPTQSITYSIVSELTKVEHNHPMLSLDKTKDPKGISSFVSGQDWFAMFKMDGLTCSLTYENGKLVRAETRGNGIIGENILHNAIVMSSIPKYIPVKETVVIDGEVICTYKDFEKFKNEYSHPRNFAAGSIRLLDSKESASRALTFVAWDLVKGCEDIDFTFWRLEKLDDWGFITVPRVGDAETVEDAIAILNDMRDGKDAYKNSKYQDYPIDGYVFKFESKKYGESLGRTEHHFKNAIAFKFYDDEYETELLDIEWSMGKTGVLTPVAIFEPVEIDSTIVERASLHNLSILRETLGTYPEMRQKIWVAKMNQIIPQITRAEKNDSYHDHILQNGICTICPICFECTEIVQSESGVYNVVCVNSSCKGKLANRIDHFCGKKGLDIKGISMATIEKLIDWGWLNGLTDIFRLNEHKVEWISKAGFGEASVGKILSAIDSAGVGTSVQAFISALGIPLVGSTISKEITKYYTTWNDFREAVGSDWTEFEGFGPEISKAINSFNYTEADEIAELLEFAEDQLSAEQTEVAAIKDKVFCVTGKLVNYTRDSIKAEIESLGGKVVGSISSKVNYLITNTPDSGTSKNKDAAKLGIPIITEEEYIKMKS